MGIGTITRTEKGIASNKTNKIKLPPCPYAAEMEKLDKNRLGSRVKTFEIKTSLCLICKDKGYQNLACPAYQEHLYQDYLASRDKPEELEKVRISKIARFDLVI